MGTDVADALSPFGRYHFCVLLVGFLCGIPVAWILLSTPFLAPEMPHWCAPPQHVQFVVENKIAWRNLAIPNTTHGQFSKCEMFATQVVPETGTIIVHKNETLKCNEWYYDQTHYQLSTVNEWNLVCENDYQRSVMQSVIMLGSLVGALIFGRLSDRFGRKFVLYAASLLYTVLGIASAFSTSLVMLNITRFIMSVSSAGLQASSISLFMEIMPKTCRNLLNLVIGVGFALPLMLLPLLPMYIRTWWQFQLVIGLSPFIVLVPALFIQESPKWLITDQQCDKARRTVRKIIRFNKRPISSELLASIEWNKCQQQQIKTSSFQLTKFFKTPRMRRYTLSLFCLWPLTMLIYFKLALEATVIPGNAFVNYSASSSIEILASIVSLYVVKHYGRRPSQVAGLTATVILGGIIPAVMPEGSAEWVYISLNASARFFLFVAVSVQWIHVVEVFPTEARSFGFSICLVAGRSGAMLAPFLRDLAIVVHSSMPHVVVAIGGFISLFFVLLLPETLNKTLPDTFEEVERYSSSNSHSHPNDVNSKLMI